MELLIDESPAKSPSTLLDKVDVRNVHPRENPYFAGHALVEAKFLRAWHSGFFNPACIISGSNGIGKATFAYRIARYVLGGGDSRDSLDMDFSTDCARQIAKKSHANMTVLEPGLPKLPGERGQGINTGISIQWIRKTISEMHQTSAQPGWRVCIIDKMDDIKESSLGVVLKILEEPPPQSLFLLICASPAQLPPTIRSRCQEYHLLPIGVAEVQAFLIQHQICGSGEDANMLAQLSAGNIGRALLCAQVKAFDTYDDFMAILQASLTADKDNLGEDIFALAEKIAHRDKSEKNESLQNIGHSFGVFIDICSDYLAKAIVAFAGGDTPPAVRSGDSDIIANLRQSPQPLDSWLELKSIINEAAMKAYPPLRLDKQQTVLEILWRLRYACGGEWSEAIRKFG